MSLGRETLACCGLFALLAAGAARAESASGESAAPAWLRAPSARGPLSSVLAYDSRWAYGSLAAGVPLGARLRSGGVSSRDALPGFSVNAVLSASGQPGRVDSSPSWLRGALLLDRSGARSGGWLGLSSGEGRTGTSEVTLRLGLGAWRALTPIQIEGSVVTSVVAFRGDPRWSRTIVQHVPVGDDSSGQVFRDSSYTVSGDHMSRWLSGQGAARWQRGRIELEASGGVTAGEGATRRRWAQAAFQLQLSRRALLLASFGTRPAASLAFDPAGRPRSMIGVQLAPWSSPRWAMASAIRPSMRAWVTRRAPAGRLAIFLRCQDAKRVELASDFTDWLPTTLEPAGGGWWELIVPVEPGLHRVRARLDGGAWEVPPGLPRSPDEAEAPAGVLLVE